MDTWPTCVFYHRFSSRKKIDMANERKTIEEYVHARQERRERLIVQYLRQLQSSREGFEDVTGLADMVSKHISYQEQHLCNKATLLRNSRYKALLLAFIAARQED